MPIARVWQARLVGDAPGSEICRNASATAASRRVRAPRAPAPRPGTAGSTAGTSGPAPPRRSSSGVPPSIAVPIVFIAAAARPRMSSDMKATLTASPARCAAASSSRSSRISTRNVGGAETLRVFDISADFSPPARAYPASSSRYSARRRGSFTVRQASLISHRARQRRLPRAWVGLGEAIGMQLPRQILVRRLGRAEVDLELPRQPEHGEPIDRPRPAGGSPCTPRRTAPCRPPSHTTNRSRSLFLREPKR